ncbi:hypothetical protein NUSPORA_01976 [Nucleospora cyclopteri]
MGLVIIKKEIVLKRDRITKREGLFSYIKIIPDIIKILGLISIKNAFSQKKF